MTRTDIEVAGLLGGSVQFDPLGRGESALLAAATTPIRLIAEALPSRMTRSDFDCAAYQSRIASAFLKKNALILPRKVGGATFGRRGGSGLTSGFDAGSSSAARRAR